MIDEALQFAPSPTSLKQAACLVARGCDYSSAMKEFIDHLIRIAMQGGGWRNGCLAIPEQAYLEEPEGLSDPVHRTHMAGMAEHIAQMSGRQAPAWCEKPEYFLTEARFAGGASARQFVINHTPSAFRRRLFFCGPVLDKLHKMVGERPSE